MIPNALATTEPYASLWAHLKSMDHALERATTGADTTELDRDRMRALVVFLRGGLGKPESESRPVSLLDYMQADEPDYSAAFDLKQQVTSVAQFRDWPKLAKNGYEERMRRLIQAVDDYLGEMNGQSVPTRVPAEEFAVLRAILRVLVAEAEASLYELLVPP